MKQILCILICSFGVLFPFTPLLFIARKEERDTKKSERAKEIKEQSDKFKREMCEKAKRANGCPRCCAICAWSINRGGTGENENISGVGN